MDEDRLSFWESDGLVWIRLAVDPTLEEITTVREFAERMIRIGKRNFAVDLSDHKLLSDYFLGALTGIALRIRDTDLQIMSASAEAEDQIRNLGLDQMMEIVRQSSERT